MKGFSIKIILILSIISVLGACSDKNESSEENADSDTPTENKEQDSSQEDSSKEDGLSELLESIEEAEDQLDLSIGDTGSFVTTLGTYDMTVTSAKLLGYEFEGIESEIEEWVLLDVTIKNTSDEPLNAEDLISSMELTEMEEGSGYMDSAGAFDSVAEFEGEIGPGEEQSAQFIAYAYESDIYYFRKSSGNVAAGGSNQVIWNIKIDDMEK